MRSLAKSMCQEWDLKHSPTLQPEDLLYFVYLDEFASDWKELHPDDTDDISLWALEILIMASPAAAPVVEGTGGLRKIRYGKSGAGKRGSDRICYAYFPETNIILMMTAYRKNEQDTLSKRDKKGIREYLDQTGKWLNEHE